MREPEIIEVFAAAIILGALFWFGIQVGHRQITSAIENGACQLINQELYCHP